MLEKLDLSGIEFDAEMEYCSDASAPNNWAKAEVEKDGVLYECWWFVDEPDVDLDEQNIDWAHPNYWEPIERYCLETVKHGELVENSAEYFVTEQGLQMSAVDAYLEDGESLYVTVLNGDTWEYDTDLTKAVNDCVVY